MTKTKSQSKAKSKSNRKSNSKKSESGIPKKVAGVKIPKAVREPGTLSNLFNSALGREIIADALIAAAGAAAAALTRSRTVKDAGKAAADAGASAASAGSDLTHTAAGAVATVVTEAAKTLLPASMVGGEEQHGSEEQRDPARTDENRPPYVHLASDQDAGKGPKKGEKVGKR